MDSAAIYFNASDSENSEDGDTEAEAHSRLKKLRRELRDKSNPLELPSK